MAHSTLWLTRGGEVIGILTLDGRKVIPNTDAHEAAYHVTPAFESVRKLFERDAALLDKTSDGAQKEWGDVWDELQAPGLFVESPDGRDRTEILWIHFTHGRAWWFPLYATSSAFHKPASRFSKRRTIGGIRVEVVFYGAGNDWLCRLGDARLKPKAKAVHDSYLPARDLGFLWIREDFGRWYVTGTLDLRLGKTQHALDSLTDFVAYLAAGGEVCYARNIAVTSSPRLRMFDGESVDSYCTAK